MEAKALPVSQGDTLALAKLDVYATKMQKPELPEELDMEAVIRYERATEDFVDECKRLKFDMRVAADTTRSPSAVLVHATVVSMDLLYTFVQWVKRERVTDHQPDFFGQPFDLAGALAKLGIDDMHFPEELKNKLPDWTHEYDIRPAVLLCLIGEKIGSELDKTMVNAIDNDLSKRNITERMAKTALIWPQIRDLAQRELDAQPSHFWNLKTKRSDDDDEDLPPAKKA